MSQAASSAWETGAPRLGPAANAGLQMSRKRALRVNMAHPTVGFDRPTGGTVVMLARESHRRGHARGLAAHRDDLLARRLRIAGFVPRAALQHCRTAVPLPRQAKARERLAHHRLLPRRLPPRLAPGGGDTTARAAADSAA